MTRLSVNINKIATLRNARGGNLPDVVQAAKDIQRYGAEGITVHPRPDERHIRYRDVFELRPIVTTEFNMEGNPFPSFIELVLKAHPEQVTLVPDPHDAITSNAGWDTLRYEAHLRDIISEFKKNGIRTSIFVDPVPEMIKGAAKTGTDRIELYTESFAKNFSHNPIMAVKPYLEAAYMAKDLGLEINAGHDLNLDNLQFLIRQIPFIAEVSIGHALICDALYYGLENTVQMYLREIRKASE